MKLIEHVYALKNIFSRGVSSDDFRLSNRLIAHFLQVARARLIEQKIDKYHFISEQSYQDWCVELEVSSFHSCCDVPALECQVLRSTIAVPKFLNSRWGNHLKVTDLVGNVIPEINLTQRKYSKYAIVPQKTGWFMHNNHVYIINNSVIQKIILNALFNDPEQVYDFNCSNNGEGTCADFMDTEFPVDSDLIDSLYKTALDLLAYSYKFNLDTENNAKDVTNEQ
jgi:hypothetical protein